MQYTSRTVQYPIRAPGCIGIPTVALAPRRKTVVNKEKFIYVRCTVARARGGVVPTLGITAAKVSRGAPHPGYHRPRRGPGCGYHIDQARGLARGGNGVGIHCTPRFPFRKLATVKNVPEHRSGPSRSDVWRTNLAYRINYTSDGMDSKSQSHTQSNQEQYRYHPGQNTPGITKRGQARGAAHPGYHDSGACPQVRRSQ